MSHRGGPFEVIMKTALRNCRELLNVPDTHEVIIMQGGGSGAFSSVPLNLTQSTNDTVSYVVTGHWSATAAKEARKYANVEILCDSKDASGRYNTSPDPSTWKKATAGSKYIFMCHNETQHGVVIPTLPPNDPSLPPIVADMSSSFMGAPVDVSRYGVIFAGAQKNVGPSGVVIYIVRKDLLEGTGSPFCPAVFDWRAFAKVGSLYHTPCTFSVYVTNLMFEWMKAQGGLTAMATAAEQKAKLLYDALDASNGFYRAHVQQVSARSIQNACFKIPKAGVDPAVDPDSQDADLQAAFLAEAHAAGLIELAGHRNVGAIRASIYNGMPIEGVQALIAFMDDFRRRHQQQ